MNILKTLGDYLWDVWIITFTFKCFDLLTVGWMFVHAFLFLAVIFSVARWVFMSWEADSKAREMKRGLV